jgi:hypothetical protein
MTQGTVDCLGRMVTCESIKNPRFSTYILDLGIILEILP